MSLIHRLLVGHFDLGTLVAHRPVPLRPLDDRRTRSMLKKIGKRVGEHEYVVDGDRLHYVNGYLDCPWLGAGRNEIAERFAREVAGIEDCFLVEKGIGTFRHPLRSLQAVPSWYRPPEDHELGPLPQAKAEAVVRGGDSGEMSRAVLRVAIAEGDWAEGFCVALTRHEHFHVRGNALFALGVLGSRGIGLTREAVQPVIEAALSDPHPYVAGQARNAGEALERELKWVIAGFDNGNPEVEVSTYANGWVRCPNCGWRFATYDPWAFREGRCLTCRQRLRVSVQG